MHRSCRARIRLHLGGLSFSLLPQAPLMAPCVMSSFKQSQFSTSKTPQLMHSPSTIFSTYQWGRGRPSSKAISHISSVPWPRSPSRSPSPPSPHLRLPSGLRRHTSMISELDSHYGPY
ncbi:hypothetical protein EDB89DRAFT_945071 [Lactarius sanguifluus]|nr:hypothetical protein EDB89DRAFT_945071 [Lactarius sanguifluus]